MTFKTSQFGYNKATETLSAFASDLGLRAWDGFPQSFQIEGKRGTFLFNLLRVERDREGDITEIVYRHPTLPHGSKVRIFND